MTIEATRGESPPRVQAILEIGATVTHEDTWEGEPGVDRTRYVLLDTVSGVHLPLSANEWMMLATRDGEAYVGGCCGNTAAVQDVINGIFRDSGYVEAADLLYIGEVMYDHDGEDSPFAPMDDDQFAAALVQLEHAARAAQADDQIMVDPWFKIGIVFNAVEPMLKPRGWEVPQDKGRLGDEHALISTLRATLTRMDWGDVFTRDDPEDVAQHEANRKLLQAKVYPLAKELVLLLEKEAIDFLGFAIVDPTTGEIHSDHRGLCLYPARENAERTMELWARYAEEEAQRLRDRDGEEAEQAFWTKRRAEIVPATVTLVDGLVLR